MAWASLVAQLVKDPPAMQETCVPPQGWEDSLEKGMTTTPEFWPGEFQGLYKESNTTERLSLHFTYKNKVFLGYFLMSVENL